MPCGEYITIWFDWFLEYLAKALLNTDIILEKVLQKRDFKGKLTSSKWAKIAKRSADTALRDIQDLMTKGALQKENAGG